MYINSKYGYAIVNKHEKTAGKTFRSLKKYAKTEGAGAMLHYVIADKIT